MENYQEYPILLIILLRCFPLIPHLLVNFLCANCSITIQQMFFGTLIGFFNVNLIFYIGGMPHAICYVLFGSEISLYMSIGSIFNTKSFLIITTAFIITLIPFLIKNKIIKQNVKF